VKARVFLILVSALAVASYLGAQTSDNMVWVKTFKGSTVGAKIAAAQLTCSSNAAIPCYVVVDASLAAAAPGVVPPLCAQCVLVDYRVQGGKGLPGGSGGGVTSWKTRVGAVVPVAADYDVSQVTHAATTAGPNTFLASQTFQTANPNLPAAVDVGGAGLASPQFIQSNSSTYNYYSQTSDNTGACTNCTLALPGAVAAGDVLIVVSQGQGMGPNFSNLTGWNPPTDSLGTVYTQGGANNWNGHFVVFWIGTAPRSAASDLLTFVVTVSPSNIYYSANEYRGVSAVLDGSPSLAPCGIWPGCSSPVNLTVTTTTANDFLFSAVPDGTWNAGAGWSTHWNGGPTVNPGGPVATADSLQGAPGVASVTWTGATPGVVGNLLFALKPGYVGQSFDMHQFKDAQGNLLSAVNALGQYQLPVSSGLPANSPMDGPGAVAYDRTNKCLAVFDGAWFDICSSGGLAVPRTAGTNGYYSIASDGTISEWVNTGALGTNTPTVVTLPHPVTTLLAVVCSDNSPRVQNGNVQSVGAVFDTPATIRVNTQGGSMSAYCILAGF
jgi:hypothetical protein